MKALRRVVVFGCVIAGAVGLILLLNPDQYHTPERRAAKARMIEEIADQLASSAQGSRDEDGSWWNEEIIRFSDGSWIAYRAQCHKADPKVYDLFIGRGSNGRWYYSTYHFCVGMMLLHSTEQPESLDAFVSAYALEEFDGQSDEALRPTWPASQAGSRG
ncbi:hypothetical protein [Haloferula sp. A504]|uniref:hypothetical protein n=1 Tax=Haloferula sp. A504 TaxID=3373601 RepID=UPI0031C08010|nr:hypothetical protein [Verrucomicrobiaceae bacterium E54]